MAASGDIMLTAAQEAALLEALPDNGDSVTLDVGADGVMRAGVTFTCMSDYPCTVTVMNSADTILATWASQTLGDGTASAMATGHEPPPVTDPLAELNDGGASMIAGIINVAIDVAATTGPPATPRGAYSGTNNALGGLGLGDSGAHNIDEVTLTSSLNPNAADYDTTGATPTGGSMLSAMDDNVMTNADTVALDGWSHKVLFRDWGDTGDGGDGGYETGALIYSNMEAPTSMPFDSDLSGMFANPSAAASYAFTVRLDGVTVDAANPADSVAIAITADQDATEQTRNMMLTVEAPQLSTLATTVSQNSEHKGTYFGAPGTFKCTSAGCQIRRAETGSTPFGVDLAAAATWAFMPDADATILVPDQDWMIYGAWLTTPDVMAGTHRLGVFSNGMNPYGATNAVFTAADANALHGTATYSGGAAGVYVDRSASGMFTASASLTANFDVNGDGDGTDAGDFTMSGRIDNFMDTAGNYLGTDTAAMPNDPMAGGENDWVVLIPSTALTADTGAYASVAGTPATLAGGSADGIPWSGQWSAQFYGAGDTAEDAMAPTGVAGSFRAITANIGDDDDPMYKGVVGAFGAEQD